MANLELKIARRYLRAKKQEGVISVVAALSVIGIALGVATLIIVMSVMNGFRAELLGRILGINSHVSLYGNERGIENYGNMMFALKNDDRVQLVTPQIEGHGVIFNPNHKNAVDGVKIRGLGKDSIEVNPLIKNKDFVGDLVGFGRTAAELEDGYDNESIVLGYKLAQALGVNVGSYVSIITPQSIGTAFGSIPRKKTFRVSGLFNIGMHEYDRYMAFMSLSTAQIMFDYGSKVESVGVMLKDPNLALPFAQEMEKKLSGTMQVIDWQQANSQFFGAVQTERNVMFIILTMIVLVASFNIIGSMIMLVQEKSGSIAIMRTMGMARKSVMRIFIIVGSFNGVVGTLSGVLIGVLFCENIQNIQYFVEWVIGGQVFSPEVYFLSNLPAKVNWVEVAEVSGISLLISLLATVYPSWRASKIDPAEVLRYE